MPTKISPVGSSASSGGGASIGGLVTGGTEGSVLFVGAGGVLAQDNTNFFWDDTANSLKAPKIVGLFNGYGFANASLTWVNGSQISSNADGKVWFGTSANNSIFSLNGADLLLAVASNVQVAWGTSTEVGASGVDTGLARIAAGIIKITNGSSGFGSLLLGAQSATNVPAQITLAAAQTADAQQVFANDGTTKLFAINQAGSPMTKANAAPADGTINSNECYIWFDSTAGTASINFKGKNSSGTVVTATLPLT